MLGQLDHVTITVSDMQRSVQFYRDLLGFEVLGQLRPNEGFRIVYLSTGGGVIELFEFGEKGEPSPALHDPNIGLKHVGFKVNSVDDVAMRLKEHEVKFTLEPLDATGGVRIAFFLDPDGVLLEVVEGELDLDPYEG